MRVLLLPLAAFALGAPSTPPAPVEPIADMPVLDPFEAPAKCPETPMSLAKKMAERPELVPLTKLPDAMTFGAVDRRIEGCPAPLVLGPLPTDR